MVLGILIAVITAPGLLGSQEAIRQGQAKDKREEHRARRCNLIATCVKSSPRSREIDGRPVVLRNGKLWIDTTTEDGQPFGHTYAGYYLPYPDTKYEGLVTTITDAAPIMNWVYVDAVTYEVKYGVRADAQPNLTGPFDCTRQDRRLTFDGWEGWCAVEEYEGYWCLYFDVDDDGLKSKVASGIRVLEIELSRKEKRFKKDKDARQQNQTTKRAVKTEEDAPVDQPLQQEPEVRHPGVFQSPEPEPGSTDTENTAPTRPMTPPPAYSRSEDKTTSPPGSSQSRKGAVGVLDEFLATEAQAQIATQQIQRQLTTPPRSTLPNVVPLDERRVTPKLNRNSGSKAIAQAQMFEAMAAAQLRDDNGLARRVSGRSARMSTSSRASASVYSEDGQISNQDVRPQSSVSQRANDSSSAALPVREQPPLTDPAIFAASVSTDSKRNSRASASSQRKRSSKTYVARRPGKRVSPRSSLRKSLVDTMSSRPGKAKQSSTSSLPVVRMPKESRQIGNRAQTGRKTTSAYLRDLDDLVGQESVTRLPRNGQNRGRAGTSRI
jgi:hypothetical protein